MNLFVKLVEVWTPGFVRRQALEALFAGTAEAFGYPVPPPIEHSYAGRLREYARFTRWATDEWLTNGQDGPEVERRLFEQGKRLGQKVRRLFHLRTNTDALAAGRWLYRLIGIEFQRSANGDSVVSRCFFSSYYSGRVCRLMSAMDDGVFAGLSGGGRLTFTQRITEGYGCCKATFVPREGAS
jgi:hypothetical protein